MKFVDLLSTNLKCSICDRVSSYIAMLYNNNTEQRTDMPILEVELTSMFSKNSQSSCTEWSEQGGQWQAFPRTLLRCRVASQIDMYMEDQ